MSFPDGEAVTVGDPKLDVRLAEFFGRPVSVADMTPPDARFDEVWVRDLKGGAEPYFGMESRVEEGEEMIDGGGFMRENGNFFNYGDVHLVTSGSVRELGRHAPQSRFDAHRFRPNLVVDTDDDGFVETAWQGRTLLIGARRAPGLHHRAPLCHDHPPPGRPARRPRGAADHRRDELHRRP